jgi:AcrR family transcriptional regulator
MKGDGMREHSTASARQRGRVRQQLLDAAARRFYADGVTATGIDTITAEAGVAKMSLYNNFASKADLVQAYLQARHEEWLALYRHRLEEARDARDGVMAVFDAYADHAALAYEQVEDLLAGHLEELRPGHPDEARALAEHLAFLLEGAVARAGLEGDAVRLQHARRIASGLLDTL